ncbi:AraC family transcriptional regulator [Neobacillus mesonae]|nr:AraC family transcriptional regulator [Neobacillus mesonae]
MKDHKELFEKVYATILDRSDRYDGIYYVAIRTTGIYCRPSCRSRTPKPENVTVYHSIKEAERNGYRACKRCEPHRQELRNPDSEIADRVTGYIEAHYHEPLTLNRIASELSVSPYHMQRVYKRTMGLTPAQQLQHVRIERAKELIKTTSMEIRDIAASVGFKSASHFISVFQKITGRTPQQYRN